MEKEQEQGSMEVDDSQETTGSQPFVTAESRLFGDRHSTEVTDLTQAGTAEASATSEARDVPPVEYVCNRFSGKTSHIGSDEFWWKCVGAADAIGFKVDRDLWIVGVGLYPARKPVPWDVSAALLDKDGVILTSTDASFEGNGGTEVKTVRFPAPVKILADETYAIKAEITSTSEQDEYDPFKTLYGDNGLKVVKVETPNGTVVFTFNKSALSTNHTEPGYGQIPQILFSV